ncbi:hypothetical protein [Halalkalibacter oceani]|uniref:hypothetical protein n=1 Tax=Halalkalibacter oceani TaxID=1653776 RepID=UPI0033936EA3
MVTVVQTCRMCKKEHSVQMKKVDYDRVNNGEHIQNAAPYLTADERELLISGICGKCFDELFAGDEE